MALSAVQLAVFERFWAAYPRRPENPKAAARAVFGRLLLAGVDPEAIVAGAAAYAALCRREAKDPKFIPHARTWLSQRRFEDYQDEAPASAPAGEPSPEPHPLAWLLAEIGEEAWRSWIAPLRVETTADGARVVARTGFALDRVRRDWGRRIETHYGQVVWAWPNPKPIARS